MRILFSSDWHIDQTNLDHTVPVAEWLIKNAPPYDLFLHGGDVAVHRGSVHPHVSWQIRRLVRSLAMQQQRATNALVIRGNHDDSFRDGLADTLVGIFGDTDTIHAYDQPLVDLALEPCVKRFDEVAIVCVPTPNKYQLKATLENNPDLEASDVQGLMVEVVRGWIATARDIEGVERVVVAYHGTVSGAQLGNELVMTSGIDVALPHSAFAGADIVLAGHIHHRQTLSGGESLPEIWIPGSLAPLSWSDKKLEPAAYLLDTETMEVETIELPVMHQMIEAEIDFTFEGHPGLTIQEALAACVSEQMAFMKIASDESPRVRLHVTAPGSVLEVMTPKLQDEIAEKLSLHSLNIVTERVEDDIVRFDVDAGWGIPEAFDRYMDLMQATDSDRGRLMALCREFETLIEDRHLDAHYEMKPVRISAKNWCQYEEVEVDFSQLGSLTAITGANFAGKSNLSRLILFALYKYQVAGDRLADLIRIPETVAEVSFTFKTGGKLLRVIRELKRKSNGGSATSMTLLEYVGEEWTTINEGTSASTQMYLETLIGPMDLFMACSFAGQNDVDGLLDLSPAELKDLLLEVLQRDFDSRLDNAKARVKQVESELGEVRGRLKYAEEKLEVARKDQGDLEVAKKNEIEAKEVLDSIPDSATMIASIESLQKEYQAQLDHQREVTERSGKIADLRRQAEQIKEDHDKCDAANAEADKLERGLAGALPDISAIEQRIEKAEDATAEAMRKLDEDRSAMTKKRRDYDRRLQEAIANESDLGVSVQEAAAQVDQLRAKLGRYMRASNLLDDVPCEGGDWLRVVEAQQGEIQIPPVSMSGCQFLLEATKSRDRIPSLKSSLSTMTRVLESRESSLKVAKQHRAELKSRSDDIYRDAEAKDQAGLEKKNELQRDLHALRSELKTARWAHDEAQATKEKIVELRTQGARAPGLAETFRALMDKASSLNCELELYKEPTREFYEAGKKLDAAKADAARIDEARRKAQSDLSACVVEVSRLRAQAESIDGLEKETRGLREELFRLEVSQADLEFYLGALHRDGIPFLLLEQFAIPSLRDITNRYLADTNFRVGIRTEKDLVSGAQRNHVVMDFTDHRGTHPVSCASGYQRTAIGMALRNAIADLHAEATGSKIWLSIQDEGFGTMDEINLEIAKGTLRAIADRRGWFVFISHVAGMAEIADSQLVVTEEEGVSRVAAA